MQFKGDNLLIREFRYFQNIPARFLKWIQNLQGSFRLLIYFFFFILICIISFGGLNASNFFERSNSLFLPHAEWETLPRGLILEDFGTHKVSNFTRLSFYSWKLSSKIAKFLRILNFNRIRFYITQAFHFLDLLKKIYNTFLSLKTFFERNF